MIGTRRAQEGVRPTPTGTATLEECWALLAAGSADEAAEIADRLEARLRADPTATGADHAALAAVRARGHLLRGDLDAAVVLHTLARRRRHAAAAEEVADLVDLVAEVGWYRRAAELAGQHEATSGPVAEAAAVAALVEGRFGTALDRARAALAADGAEGAEHPGVLVTERVAWVVGAALLEQGHVQASLDPLRTACAAARRTRMQHVVARASCALARAHALRHQPGEGLAVLERARAPLHSGRLPMRVATWLDLAEARIRLTGGDPVGARAIVDRMAGDRPPPEVLVLQAWAALASADPEAACRLLDRGWSGEASRCAEVEADILRSRCAIGRSGVLVPLDRAVHQAEDDGSVAVFLEHGTALVAPLRELEADDPCPHVTLLLDRLDPERATAA